MSTKINDFDDFDKNDKKLREMVKNGEARILSSEASRRFIQAMNEPANPTQELIDLLKSKKHYKER